MEQRYIIREITPLTRDWTCKIQVVDKIRPKISRDQRVHFQTTIVQDENEDQICIITYGPEVPHYDNVFKHFHTYLISGAKVREPSRFAIPMHRFEWVVDTFSIVEEVTEHSEEESILPLPTRLNLMSFADIDKQIPGDEFDLVAVVANCGTMKYQGSENRRFQEVILIDDKKKPFLFTIWGELDDSDGTEVLQQLHRYPVIVAKRIAVSNFKQDVRLTTRFNSSILIDPLYPQATKLMNWAKDNKQMLIEYTLKSTSKLPSTLNVAPFEDEIVFISSIPSQSTVQSFYVEGEISLPSEFQYFFVLLCPECQHLARIKRKRKILCINCKLERMLIPKCEFEVDITDGSGTITAVVSDKLAEQMLSLTADEIYETTIIKKQLLPVEHMKEHLLDKLFKIHLQKSLHRTADRPPGSFVVLSYTQKQTVFDFAQSSTTATIGDRSKRKVQSITSEEIDRSLSTQHGNPTKKPHVQSTSPLRK